MTRKDRIDFYLKQLELNRAFLKANEDRLSIYRGNLLPFVDKILKNTLSESYYSQIRERIVPINVLTRIMDKLSKVYINKPMRKAENDQFQEFVERVEKEAKLDQKMAVADVYSHLFKAYAIKPYLYKSKIQLRVIPFDRFLPLSTDEENPTVVTDFIEIMDENKFFAYTADEFFAFDKDGNELKQYYEGNDGLNLYGVIPFIYGSRSEEELIPTEDTDVVQMTKMIPVMLSDLGGAIMFQCFSIIYGINVDAKNLKLSPNAFWDLKADAKSDIGNPSIGTIKPEADIDKVLSYIKQTFAFWLETKGVRIGSLNNIDAGNSSGIAKIIDEMDVYEIKKEQITYFKDEENNLFQLLGKMNDFWIKNEPEYKGTVINEHLIVETTFDEPRPEIPRSTQVDTIDKEYKGGYLDAEGAIKALYPDLQDDEVEERAVELDRINNRLVTNETPDNDQDNQDMTDENQTV